MTPVYHAPCGAVLFHYEHPREGERMDPTRADPPGVPGMKIKCVMCQRVVGVHELYFSELEDLCLSQNR